MALNANVIWEVRTTGSDNNGGGFRQGASGTDRSQQNAAFATLSASSVVHTTTTQINVAVGDYTVVAGDVGNIIQVTGGTATAGFYEITVADVANNRWTVDRAVGTAGQTVVGNMGGALASIGKIGAVAVSGNYIYIKSGTYTISSATYNVSGGCVSSGNAIGFEGYDSSRGDLGTRPLLQASGISTFQMINSSATTGSSIINIDFDGASLSSSRGFTGVNRTVIYLCKFSNFTNRAALGAGYLVLCEGTGCSSQAVFEQSSCLLCNVHDNTITGYLTTLSGNQTYAFCIADTNTGASSDGFQINATTATIIGCVAYNNGRDGFRQVFRHSTTINCIAENNGGWGFNVSANETTHVFANCATYNNTSGGINLGTGKFVFSFNPVTGAGSFFTDAPNANFSLNNTAGAGALCRAAGIPGTMPGGTTVGYMDIGVAQILASAGGGESSYVF